MCALCGVLERNSHLALLDLFENEVLDDGALAVGRMLATNSTLTELEPGATGISATGVAAITSALERNSTLTFLGLSHPNGVAGDAALLSLLEHHNSTLCTLHGIDAAEPFLARNRALVDHGMSRESPCVCMSVYV